MKKNLVTVIALIISACMIGAGLYLNQNSDVLQKAARICLECVGIG